MRYDIIGDVHGCFDELVDLLRRLGHRVDGKRLEVRPGRQVVFVGDLVDRGPKVAEVLELVMDAAGRGAALGESCRVDAVRGVRTSHGRERAGATW